MIPEVQARYLRLMQDEVESTLRLNRYPCESVTIVNLGGRYAVVVVPPEGDLPEDLVAHLMGEGVE